VECVFGILSNKWRIFQLPINVGPEFAVDIVKACVFLHNFIRERETLKYEDALTVTANNVRNKVAEYFLTAAGTSSWQI
jgi:hypothetical protein